jgi:transposase-like protein
VRLGWLKMSDHQRRDALQRTDAGESVVELARTFGVERATPYRMQALASALGRELRNG